MKGGDIMQWKLIRLRKENNYNQEEMAKILGVSEATYRNKENGKTQFKLDEMFVIAEYFNKTLDDVFLHLNRI